jgi:gamma-glutamyltranspeptidase/glutathione hydrolase
MCGAIIENDQVVAGGWGDVNVCPPASKHPDSAPPGVPVQGRGFQSALSSRGGVVASGSPLASRVGVDVLDAGGTAMDAAVATVFAMGVTEPHFAGIGGAGWLIYRSANGKAASLDFEPTVPLEFDPEAFGRDGIHKTGTGHMVVAVPGVVAGMSAALERFGTIDLADAIAPAERLAHDGVPVSVGFSSAYKAVAEGPGHDDRLRMFPAAADIYLHNGDQYPPDNELADSTLVQRDYARSLALVARFGPDAFYEDGQYPTFDFGGHHYEAGPSVARLIVDDMENPQNPEYEGDEGLMTMQDLSEYEAKWRDPIKGHYRGNQIVTSLGVTLETLNIMEGYDVGSLGHSTADYFHLFAEAQKIAWADQVAYVGDPDYVDVPKFLTSKDYAAQRRSEIDPDHAQCYGPGQPGMETPPCEEPAAAEDGHTVHISVVDRYGNAVAVTFTIGIFGSAVVAPGTGFLLNSTVGTGGPPGSRGEDLGGRRVAEWGISPTIVVKGGRPILVVGAAGGASIPMGVVLAISNVIDFGLPIDRALDAARLDERTCCTMRLEDGRIREEVLTELQARGHGITYVGEYYFSPVLHAVGYNPSTGGYVGASDPRDFRGVAAQTH